MLVKVFSWIEALTRYRSRWIDLVEEAGLNPSLHPGWMDAALQSHNLASNTRVAVVETDGVLAAVIPVVLRPDRVRGVPVNVAELASNVVAYHPELIARSPSPDLLEAVFGHSLSGQWDVLRLHNIPDHSPTAAALEEWMRRRKSRLEVIVGEHSPYIRIDTDWDGFLRARPKKFRANVTRVLRKPSEYGCAEMRWFGRDADCERLLADIIQVERQSWKAVEGVAIHDREDELAYHQRLLSFLRDSGFLFANVLYVDGSPVAYVLCCHAGGWIGQLKTSFCGEVKDSGACAVTASVLRAFECGATEYDFLGNADPHKLKWTDSVRTHSSYLAPAHTLRARAVSALGGVINRGRRVLARRASITEASMNERHGVRPPGPGEGGRPVATDAVPIPGLHGPERDDLRRGAVGQHE